MCKGVTGPIAPCQVLGCRAELKGSLYSAKRRVCSQHRQALAVLLRQPPNGDPADSLYRFCQQHGRLELLSGFDGARKSCRESARTRSNRRCRAAAHNTGGRGCGCTRSRRAAARGTPAHSDADTDSGDASDHNSDDDAWMDALFSKQQDQQGPASPGSLQEWLCGAASTTSFSSGDGDGGSQISQSPAAVSSSGNDAKPMATDSPSAAEGGEGSAPATTDFIAALLQDDGFWSFAAAHSDLDSLCAAASAAGADGSAADGAGQQQQSSLMAADEPTFLLEHQQQMEATAAATESCGPAGRPEELLTALSGSSSPCSPALLVPSLSAQGDTTLPVLGYQPHSNIQQLATPSPAGLCQSTPAAASVGLPSPAGLVHGLPIAAQAAAGTIAALGSGPLPGHSPAMLQCLLEQELLAASAPAPVTAPVPPQHQLHNAQALRQQRQEQERLRARAQVHRRLRKQQQWLAKQKLATLLRQQPDLLAAVAFAAATSG